MRRLLALNLFYISACISVYAQSIIRFQGTVLRDGDSPVPGASITLYHFQSAADSTLAAFAIADKDGNFNIALKGTATAYRLTVRAMNYAEQSQKVEGTAEPKPFRFVLQPQALVLNDVVVRASKAVQEDGDKTIYQVAAFRTGEERTVEDILKKLPGISVDDQGRIRVQGKLIDGVLVEGEDILSKNYRLITRSLDAEAIDKIEAINNHTDRPMLREVEKSGKTVLNLTIKKDRLVKPFGNAGLALGVPEQIEATAVMFSLLGKLKMGVVGNGNNTGIESPTELEEDVFEKPNGLQRLDAARQDIQPFIQGLRNDIPTGFNARRATVNKLVVAGSSASWRLNNRLKAKASLIRETDRQAISRFQTFQYLIDSLHFEGNDQSNAIVKPRRWQGQLTVDMDVSSRTMVRWYSTFSSITKSEDRQLTSTVLLPIDSLVINADDNRLSSRHWINMVHKLKTGLLLEITTGLDHTTLWQNARQQRIDVGVSGSIHQSSIPTTQDISINRINWQTSIQLKGVYKTGNREPIRYMLMAGGLWNNDRFRSELVIDSLLRLPNSKQQNSLTYTRRVGLLAGQLTLPFHRILLAMGAAVQVTTMDLAYTGTSQINESKPLIAPTITASYSLRPHKRLSISYFQNQLLPEINNLTTSFVQTGYRTFQQGSALLNTQRLSSFLVSYSMKDLAHFAATSASFSVQRSTNTYLNTIAVGSGQTFIVSNPTSTPLLSLMGNISAEKLLKPLSTKCRLDFTGTRAEQLNGLSVTNSRLYHYYTADVRLYLISAFQGPFNAELGVQYFQNWAITHAENVTANRKGVLIRPYFLSRLKLSSEYMIELSGERYQWNTKTASNATSFLDASIRYMPRQKLWSFQLLASNLFNVHQLLFWPAVLFYTTQNGVVACRKEILI